MSQEEQDQILGRLTREHTDVRKRIAALEIKLQEKSSFYRRASDALMELSKCQFGLDVEFFSKLDGDTRKAVDELKSDREKLLSLSTQLQKFN